MVYQDRIKTNLLQILPHTENSECFSTMSVVYFEVKIVTEQKQASRQRLFLFSISFHCPQLFHLAPCRCSGVHA